MNHEVTQATDSLMPKMTTFLTGLVRIESPSGDEYRAMAYLEEHFSRFNVIIERVPLSDELKADPDYSSPIADLTYDGRHNLRITKPGRDRGRKIIFNAHVDTVPPSEGMTEPYSGRVENGRVYGRGACDTKGPLAAAYLLIALLEKLDVQPTCDIEIHLVVEEENGGNGSLAMVRQGGHADACIVLEPTEHKVLTAIRGAVWFKIDFRGVAGHSGQASQTKSALLLAIEAIELLTAYHVRLLSESRGIDLFDSYPNPMPITFGKLVAGNWPASAPSHATLEGVLGFLPNKTKERICHEMQQTLRSSPNLNVENCTLSFTYRHDCSVVESASALPQALLRAHRAAGVDTRIDAMPASCDAWFYNNTLGIPTVVYGPGSLKVAHSKDEHIELTQIKDAAVALLDFVCNDQGDK